MILSRTHNDFQIKASHGSDDISQITPFSTWEISLPKTKDNQSITFHRGNVNITIKFILRARIWKQKVHNMLLQTKTKYEVPTEEQLIQTMNKQGSCTNGWDVVINISLKHINATLKQQHAELKEYKKTIYIKKTTEKKHRGNPYTEKIEYCINYGYPRLEFNENNIIEGSLFMIYYQNRHISVIQSKIERN